MPATKSRAGKRLTSVPLALISLMIVRFVRLDKEYMLKNPEIVAACCISIGRMGQCGLLPLPAGTPPVSEGAMGAAVAAVDTVIPASKKQKSEVSSSRVTVIESLLALTRSDARKRGRVIEEAVVALAKLAVGDPSLKATVHARARMCVCV